MLCLSRFLYVIDNLFFLHKIREIQLLLKQRKISSRHGLKIMPNFVQLNEGDVKVLLEDGGLSKSTKQARSRIVQYFKNFLSEKSETSIDDLLHKVMNNKIEDLEEEIMSFFTFLRVNTANREELPKRGTSRI